MTEENTRLVTDEVAASIIEAYKRGDKIRTIVEEHGVAKATVYWVLERGDVTPDRVKRGRRLVGDDQQLAQLYDLIQAQDERIQALVAQVEALGHDPVE